MFVVLKQNWKTLFSYGYMQNKIETQIEQKKPHFSIGQNMQNKKSHILALDKTCRTKRATQALDKTCRTKATRQHGSAQNHARHKMDAENKLENESDKAP